MAPPPTSFAKNHETSVYFHVSSLIGYVRILLTAYSFYLALDDYQTSALCYALSFVCDFFDGFVARLLNQRSNYHAMLDVVTDRCSTAGLLLILSHLYPSYLLTFLYLLILDVASHWYHMYSCKGHHKCVSGGRTWLLRFYYGVYPFFGFCCIGTELFYILLYVRHFDPHVVLPGLHIPLDQLCFNVCLPACVAKNIVNVFKLASGANAIAQEGVIDTKGD